MESRHGHLSGNRAIAVKSAYIGQSPDWRPMPDADVGCHGLAGSDRQDKRMATLKKNKNLGTFLRANF